MARSDGEKQSDKTTKGAIPRAPAERGAEPAEKRSAADNTQQQKAVTDDAKLRSDWEGMAPKPDQASDDVAAPGKLPESKHSEN